MQTKPVIEPHGFVATNAQARAGLEIVIVGNWRHECEPVGAAAQEDDDQRPLFVAIASDECLGSGHDQQRWKCGRSNRQGEAGTGFEEGCAFSFTRFAPEDRGEQRVITADSRAQFIRIEYACPLIRFSASAAAKFQRHNSVDCQWVASSG
jgi:hypothetical protein